MKKSLKIAMQMAINELPGGSEARHLLEAQMAEVPSKLQGVEIPEELKTSAEAEAYSKGFMDAFSIYC